MGSNQSGCTDRLETCAAIDCFFAAGRVNAIHAPDDGCALPAVESTSRIEGWLPALRVSQPHYDLQ
jgi:hypothetical protein